MLDDSLIAKNGQSNGSTSLVSTVRPYLLRLLSPCGGFYHDTQQEWPHLLGPFCSTFVTNSVSQRKQPAWSSIVHNFACLRGLGIRNGLRVSLDAVNRDNFLVCWTWWSLGNIDKKSSYIVERLPVRTFIDLSCYTVTFPSITHIST
jgi:hypothetical protein